MRPRDVPFLQWVIEAGPDDRVFDLLLLVGPAVIVLLAGAGRNVVTMGVAVLYLAAFVGYMLYQWARNGRA